MDVKELKAKAYDILAQIEFLQGELRKLNQQIADAAQKPEEKKEE